MLNQKFDELSPSPETAKCIINDAERALKRSLSLGEKCDLLMDRTGVPNSAEAREIVILSDRLTEPPVTITSRHRDSSVAHSIFLPAFSVLEANFGGTEEHPWTRLWVENLDGQVLYTAIPHLDGGSLEIEATDQ
jgi:hypothetical protein